MILDWNEAVYNLTDEEFKDWFLQRETQQFLKLLENMREQIKEGWAKGATVADDVYQEQRKNSYLLGKVHFIDDLKEAFHNKLEIKAKNDPS